MENRLGFGEAHELVKKLKTAIGQSIFGQEDLIEEVMCCMLSAGHILMTGAPGLAKTTLVRVISDRLGISFGRIQFTPDLLPSDILGAEILNIDPETGHRNFRFDKGAIFTNLLLADEINRASPRTQSALLEAMQERSVTIAGTSYSLVQPFMVFATQNPYESEGTFPLPEAQLDRFLLHTLVDFPNSGAEMQILEAHAASSLYGETTGNAKGGDSDFSINREVLNQLMATTQAIEISPEILTGIHALVRSSRPDDESCPNNIKKMIWYGAGPRAGLCLVSTARALALLSGDESVRWRHIERLARPALRHRIRLTSVALRDQLSEDDVIGELLTGVKNTEGSRVRGF